MIINRWKVLYEVEKNKQGRIQWMCECTCDKHTLKKVTTDSLLSNSSKSCGCLLGTIELNEGDLFNRWKVLKKDESKSGNYYICECICDAHTIKSIKATKLKYGDTKSCGCLKRENKRKYNDYYLDGEFGIGWTTNTGNIFLFNKDDYELIKDWCWIEDVSKTGYITTRESRTTTHKVIPLHRMIMGVTDSKIEIDHKYHIPYDNRREYLREVNKSENQQNRVISEYNTSGVKGVSLDKRNNRWRSYITFNGKRTESIFEDFEEAVEYRKYLEEKYFKEFAYQEPPEEYIEELEQLKQIAEIHKIN